SRSPFTDLHILDDEVTIRKDLSSFARVDARVDDLDEATQVLPGRQQMAAIHEADTLDFADSTARDMHDVHERTPQDASALELAARDRTDDRSRDGDSTPHSNERAAHDRVTLAGTMSEGLLAASRAPASQSSARTATVAAIRVVVVGVGVEGQARVTLLRSGE